MLGTIITSQVMERFVSTQHQTHSIRYFNGRKYRVLNTRNNFAHRPVFVGGSPMAWSNITISVHREFGDGRIERFQMKCNFPVMENDNDLRCLWQLHLAGDGVTEPLELEPPF